MSQNGICYEYHLPGGGSITSNLQLNVKRTAEGGYLATSRDQEHGNNAVVFISGTNIQGSTNYSRLGTYQIMSNREQSRYSRCWRTVSLVCMVLVSAAVAIMCAMIMDHFDGHKATRYRAEYLAITSILGIVATTLLFCSNKIRSKSCTYGILLAIITIIAILVLCYINPSYETSGDILLFLLAPIALPICINLILMVIRSSC